ncbi:MAG: hypothetical protein AAF513_16810 [Pseudomonadota bacterium]
MLSRSLIAFLLGLPAAMAVIGLYLIATPALPELRLPALLMIFPLWIGIAGASYMLPTRKAAAVLIAISLGGFGLIQVLKNMGGVSL